MLQSELIGFEDWSFKIIGDSDGFHKFFVIIASLDIGLWISLAAILDQVTTRHEAKPKVDTFYRQTVDSDFFKNSNFAV